MMNWEIHLLETDIRKGSSLLPSHAVNRLNLNTSGNMPVVISRENFKQE